MWHQLLLTRILTFSAGLLSKQHRNIQFPPRGKKQYFSITKTVCYCGIKKKSCLFLETYEAGQWVSGSFPRG
jgi:hypothetical protein